jgi:hypothetical protein
MAVAQIFNLPFRRIAFCGPPPIRTRTNIATVCRLQIGETAECNSALRANLLGFLNLDRIHVRWPVHIGTENDPSSVGRELDVGLKLVGWDPYQSEEEYCEVAHGSQEERIDEWRSTQQTEFSGARPSRPQQLRLGAR